MEPIDLTLACVPTDRSHPILNGRVTIPGVRLTLLPNEPEAIFGPALRDEAFDISEMSMCSHIVQVAQGTNKYVAVPVFPARSFRHSAIYIRTDRGIETPSDLQGRTIGLPDYQQTAALWVRGFLRDIYGVETRGIRWRTGGMEQPGPGARAGLELPEDVDVREIESNETLNGLLASGALDAVISPRSPSCLADDDVPVERMFKDYRSAEIDYYKITGFFPIMHCVVLKRSLAERHPELPQRLMHCFQAAYDIAIQDIITMNVPRVVLPWAPNDWAETIAVMGEDIWPYGLPKNEAQLRVMIRYCYEDGLIKRQPAPSELFHPTTIPSDAAELAS